MADQYRTFSCMDWYVDIPVKLGIRIARLTLDLDCTCHTYGLGAQSWLCGR
jgi:hypothetical protein